MKRKYTVKFLVALLCGLTSCDKETGLEEKKTATRILTEKKWILTGHGFDDNKNNVIDSFENEAADCLRDNTYFFRPDGSGTNYENENDCNAGEPVNHFTWRLVNKDSILELSGFNSKIVTLSETSLIISPYDSISFPLEDFLVSFRR